MGVSPFLCGWTDRTPWKGMLSGSASAGGELILGRRKSALFYKSPLSERQQAASSDFLKTVLAEFRPVSYTHLTLPTN